MAQLTDNNIVFTNIETGAMPLGRRVKHEFTDLSDPSDPYVEPLINAVEIDWNGAVLKIA